MMKRCACVLLLVCLLLTAGCSPELAELPADSTVPETTGEAPDEILFSTTMLSDYARFSSLSSLVYSVSVVMRATVVSQDEAIVIGDYSEEAFDRYDETARKNGRVASELMMSIRTPYTVKIEEIYKNDPARDTIAAGELTQICTIGGNCRGFYLETEFPVLAEGEEYIFFLTRRNFAQNDEPKYTLYSPYQCAILVDDLGTNGGTCADEIFYDLTLEQLPQRIAEVTAE